MSPKKIVQIAMLEPRVMPQSVVVITGKRFFVDVVWNYLLLPSFVSAV